MIPDLPPPRPVAVTKALGRLAELDAELERRCRINTAQVRTAVRRCPDDCDCADCLELAELVRVQTHSKEATA